MWLLPLDLAETPRATLPAGRYLLPWYFTDEEVIRLADLLRSLLEGVDHVLILPWASLSALARSNLPSLRKSLLVLRSEDPDLSDEDLERTLTELSCRYALVQVPKARETGYAWQEQYIKPALVSLLREYLSDTDHPLHGLNIGFMPVLLAASLTPDVLEMMDLLEAAAEHRLRFAEQGVSEADYQRSLMLAAGKRLAARLSRLSKKEASCALEVLLAEGKRAGDEERFLIGAEALEQVGLGRVRNGDLSIGPLGRRIRERPIWGGLVEGLPEKTWTKRARELLDGFSELVRFEMGLPVLGTIEPVGVVVPAQMTDASIPEGAEDLWRRFVSLLKEVRQVPEEVEALPRELQARVTEILSFLRNMEKEARPAQLGGIRAYMAIMRFDAARGEQQSAVREQVLAELETLVESGTASVRDWLRVAWVSTAATIWRRARSKADLDRAVELVSKALSQVDSHAVEAANFYVLLGRIELSRGRFEVVKECFEQALRIWSEHDLQSPSVSEIKASLVMLERPLSEVSRSLEGILLAYQEAKDERGKLGMLHALGTALASQGEFEKAFGYFEQAMTLAEHLDDQNQLVEICRDISKLAAQCGELDEATQWLQKAIALNEERNLGADADLYVASGDLSLNRGDYDEAQLSYAKALEIAERFGNQPEVDLIHERLRALAERRAAPSVN